MNILDLIFPKWCVGCGKMGKYVCDECQVGLYEEEQICPGCSRKSRFGSVHGYCKGKGHLRGLTCLWAYEGIAEKIIKRVKYKGEFDMFREIIKFDDRDEWYYLNKFLELKPVVVPVPLCKSRERERGFNQAELIAKLVARQWALGTRNLLMRTRDTGQQVGKTREVRLKNMENAFEVKTSPQPLSSIYERGVLLVDDVWTTGATMQECAKTLKKAEVKMVWGLVLAR